MAFEFRLPSSKITLPRNVALLDTNIVFALFSESDSLHKQSTEYMRSIEDTDSYFMVSHPVLVETCGLLGRRKDRNTLLSVIQWLRNGFDVRFLSTNQPIQSNAEALDPAYDLMKTFEIDYVDAHLIGLADLITKSGKLEPATQIVTFDTSDYLLCSNRGYNYDIFDMRSLELLSFK